MKARADLLHVADALAGAARAAATPRREARDGVAEVPGDLVVAGHHAHAAKAALEAAALVDQDPAPIVAALERLIDRLQDIDPGDLAAALDLSGPAEALDVVGDMLDHAAREVRIGAAVQHGYLALRELMEGLLRDFSAAETDTARRIAARIEMGLDEADQAIEQAKRQEATV